MKEAGGYTSTLRIFEGEAAAKVRSTLKTMIDVGYGGEILCWGDTNGRRGVGETIRARYLVTSNTHR
jgi:hypothetical protein